MPRDGPSGVMESESLTEEMSLPEMPKILYVSNTAWYLFNFRLSLMKAMIKAGWQVTAAAPGDRYVSKLKAQGIKFVETPLRRSNMNPFRDISYFLRLCQICWNDKPDIIHLFTAKPVIYGSFAAWIMGVRGIVTSIPGLGYIFLRGGMVKRLVEQLYKLMLRPPVKIIFQNQDDRDHFLKMKLADPGQTFLIRGSGVDTEDFNIKNFPFTENRSQIVFLLMARMLWDKGIGEYVAAARQVRAENPSTKFILLGGSDPGNPAAVPKDWLMEQHRQHDIEWIDHVDDVRPYLAAASVVVLPSYYREGLPKSLLEAGAMSKPIITTDSSGCRDIVKDGLNGILVPIKNEQSLMRAMLTLSNDETMRKVMGKAGRKMVLESFDARIINQQTLEVYRRTGVLNDRLV